MSGRRVVVVVSFALAVVSAVGCNKSELVDKPIAEASPTPPVDDPPEYLGREFFAVDLDNIYEPAGPFNPEVDAAGAQYAVAVSNPNATEANVTISNKDGEVQSKMVPADGLEIFELPRADVDGTTLVRNAYRVESDLPVTAHQFNPIGNVLVYSNDASLLLPVSTLGTTYRVLTWPQTAASSLPGYFAVAAVEDGDTEVTVTVTAATRAGGDIPALAAGGTYTRTLQRHDVLALQTSGQNGDLSGSLVTSTKKVAVFGGTECSNVPLNVTACDHLEEQMFPVSTWGRTYVAAKSMPRGTEPDVWRVLASQDNTTVTTDPYQPGTPVTLAAGQFVEFQSTGSFVVQAGAPVLVGQYLVGQDFGFGQAGNTGDPGFILSVPIEQFRSEYLFLTPPNYANDSITIIAPTGTAVTLDGVPVPGTSFTETAAGSGWSTARLSVTDGVHRLEADEPVGLTVTGYDQYVSYGYPGGLNLESLE